MKCKITLITEEVDGIRAIIQKSKVNARIFKNALILFNMDEGNRRRWHLKGKGGGTGLP